jgi:hypothetical protein
MRTYRINCTGDADQIVTTYDATCRDDLAVLEKAKTLCGTHGVEVWDGSRRVVWMHKGGAVRVDNPLVSIPLPVDCFGADPFASHYRDAV